MEIRKLLLGFFMVAVLALNISFAADYEYSVLSETLLNQDPDPAQPGEYVELRFKVEKAGNEVIENIEYELEVEYPFRFDSSDNAVKNLGDWIGNSDEKEFYILYYKLRVDQDAIEDTYEVTLKQRSSSNAAAREIDFDIRVGENLNPNLLIGKVETRPSKLIANYEEAAIDVEIVNVGDEVAEQVILNMVLPEGFDESFGYSSRINLGSIAAGESKIATFYVDTDEGLLAGNYGSNLEIVYKDASDNRRDDMVETEIPFDIQIFGRPEYEIVSFNVSELKAGDMGGHIELKIKNIGSRESDSTSIQIFKDSSQPFDFEDKSNYIGKLDVDEVGDSIFVVDVDEDALAQDYRLKLQIRSVIENDVLVEDETIVVKVQDDENPSPEDDVWMRFTLYGGFLIIGMVIGRYFTRKRYGLSKSEK